MIQLSANMGHLLLVLLLELMFFSLSFCSALNIITFSRTIKDPETIVSNRSAFRFGFFSPVNSTSRYVGIWYNNIPVQTVVWVANKNSPINDSSGVITISEDGNLVIMNGRRQILWSSNVSVTLDANSTSAQLLDSGNLVLQHSRNNREALWESFKHPCDSFLPRMTLGIDATTKTNLKLTSWKSPSDPSIGNYTAGLASQAFPELFVWKDDTPVWRSGPWNGQIFIGLPNVDFSFLFLDGFNVNNDNQGTVSMSFANDTRMYHFMLDYKGRVFQKLWDRVKQDWWFGLFKVPFSECDIFSKCGQFASCNRNKNPPCKCIEGFEPKNSTEWNRGSWTNGCTRRVPLQCDRQNNGSGGEGKADGFLRLQKMKVPYSPQRSGLDEHACPKNCLSNCSCTAYAYDSGVGCMLWSGSLFDLQEFSKGGVDLYIRLANSEFKAPKHRRTMIVTPMVVGTFVVAVCFLLWWRKVSKRREKEKHTKLLFERMDALTGGDMPGANIINQAKKKELPLFEFQVLAAATDNFSLANKLGQGGFGPAYKGKLQDGQEIAIKRLARASGQGLEELVNEVVVISKLQHRNLVRLLGCCIEGEERLLVYEFMPKKSLDLYIFDPQKQEILDWKSRFSIIEGICRGLLYLHRDSRLRIIHRDLKTSNILLDEHLNPKISDFGLARIFQGNEDEAKTRRVVGTYGYMSPEYAMGGLFSEKSDVFSLGVVLLEIISGRRNSSFYNSEQALNLLAYAWKLWNEGNVVALVDPVIYEVCFEKEISRCVHIGLLCVQEFSNDRPSISNVIWMLSSENADLSEPKQPAFIPRKGTSDTETSEQSDQRRSINNESITTVTAR